MVQLFKILFMTLDNFLIAEPKHGESLFQFTWSQLIK